ncbi:MAG TPA: phytanoyl-CoA dioxygenase family protein [Microthrixaceae bacterium]|nr:phytanoyl-CoA dioxygenase family protein [Microthrixaceae bacterium]
MTSQGVPRRSSDIDSNGLDHFNRTGWLLTETLDPGGVAKIQEWADEIAGWPSDGAGWMQHYEMTDGGPRLCRSENLIPFHEGLRNLLTTGAMVEVASALIGSQAVLYKEKINYKLAGGAGYSPHQDAPAYPFIDSHVSCMVAIDDSMSTNGCLEVVSGHHHELLRMDQSGCVHPELVESLSWDPVEVRAGQTLWFHSLTPHRSGANTSTRPRRALYPTYNALAEGDLRDDYYAHKLAAFSEPTSDADSYAGASGAGGRSGRDTGTAAETVRVSLIGDFQGRPVT